MIIHIRNGRFIFTASSLNRSRRFVCFSEGIAWTYVQKLATACAAEMR